MNPLAWIVITITSGPYQGLEYETVYRTHCTSATVEVYIDAFEADGFPVMATCDYGNGPLTSMRPVARPIQ